MPADCCKDLWNRIPDDEPVFTLLGRDQLATETIRTWIEEANAAGVNRGKIIRAQEHLDAIERFQEANPDRVKLPD